MMVTSGNHSAVQISREIRTQVPAFHRCSSTPLKKIKITNTVYCFIGYIYCSRTHKSHFQLQDLIPYFEFVIFGCESVWNALVSCCVSKNLPVTVYIHEACRSASSSCQLDVLLGTHIASRYLVQHPLLFHSTPHKKRKKKNPSICCPWVRLGQQ